MYPKSVLLLKTSWTRASAHDRELTFGGPILFLFSAILAFNVTLICVLLLPKHVQEYRISHPFQLNLGSRDALSLMQIVILPCN